MAMLGRVRRTTNLDVALALSFAGLAYLVWALVAGMSRSLVQEAIKSATWRQLELSRWLRVLFVDGGFLLDLAGLAWLSLSLVLVIFAARQRFGICWAWVSAVCQVCTAALGAVLVGWASYQPHILDPDKIGAGTTPFERVSSLSLPVLMAVAILTWVTALIWLLAERARFRNRRGPTLTDGLKTHR